jgi:1-acyl-sn-glycerol-3-phosphate acyltransferase
MRWISLMLFKISGWKFIGEYPQEYQKSVMIAAPHTSNWDILFARAAFFILRVPVKFTIKEEWLKTPIGPILRWLGAIGIERKDKNDPNRKKKISFVDAMVEIFNQREKLVILITPEGTRKYVKEWKSGFYHIANGAGVPIILGFLDYEKKEAGIGPTIHPTGNFEEDLEKIKSFYRTVKGKYPEQGVL